MLNLPTKPAVAVLFNRRWLFWGAMAVMVFSSLACRLEFGLKPGVSAQVSTQTGYTAQPVANAPVAISTRPAVPTASPTPLPTFTPSPTSTPTASSVLAPTVTHRKVDAALTVTQGTSATATPIALIPARYPPGKIIVPAINLDVPVKTADWLITQKAGVKVSVWNIPDAAAGWHKNSALPGHGSNVVLSGHHNMGSEVFRDLVKLKVGDEITLQADAYAYHYVVTDRFIVPERDAAPEQRRQNAQWILPTVDERLTLVTCWPYTGNSHRLIVVAKPTGFNEQ